MSASEKKRKSREEKGKKEKENTRKAVIGNFEIGCLTRKGIIIMRRRRKKSISEIPRLVSNKVSREKKMIGIVHPAKYINQYEKNKHV